MTASTAGAISICSCLTLLDHYENGGENELTEAMEAILESKELEMA